MSYPVFRAYELDQQSGGVYLTAERVETEAVVPSVRVEVTGASVVRLGPNDARRFSGWIAEVMRVR